MRIAIVTETYPPEINGVALTVAALAHGLGDTGHSVQVIRPQQTRTQSDCDVDDRDVDDRGVDETVLVRGVGLPMYPGLRLGLPCTRQLRALWKSGNPDAIYVATEGPLGRSALQAARELNIPASTGFHTRFDDFARYHGFGFIAPAVFGYLRRFHRRAAATLVPTTELKESLEREDFGNVMIQQQRPEARFIWVGDGPARATLQEKNPDFHFCGMQHDDAQARHYASADLFLFPSLTETFGNVTLEALASGLPIVAFDYGAAREHVNDDCGRRVPLRDEQGFARAARQLACALTLTGPMREAARRAVAMLDPQTVTANFAALLAALARTAATSDNRAAAFNGSVP